MKYAMHNMLPFRTTLGVGIALTSFATRAAASQTYCSTQNTGSDFSSVTNLYQSNGRCSDTCRPQGYAFAVVQFQQCWCSNYIPSSTTDTSDCNVDCPGYPYEQCGNRNAGLYGYIKLDASPSGTAGASSAQSTRQSSTAAPSTTEDSTTSYTFPTRSSSTSAESETSWVTMDPVTSVVMTTISGAVVTQTVTSTPVVAPNSHSDSMQISRDDGLGAGAIAGIVIGVLAALALLGLAAFLLWRRRRNAQPDGEEKAPGAGGKNLGRNVSVLSKAGLLARTRTSMVEHDNDFFAPAPGQNSNRHSLMFGPLGLGGEGVSPTSPLGSSDGSNHSRRASRPMVYDQRLNPSALFANAEANGSRVSIQDQQDYSRPIHGLAVMNPDPRPSFESRNSHRGA